MAICWSCGEGMRAVLSCVPRIVETTEGPFDSLRDNWVPEEIGSCHDCGIDRGGYHHPGCDMERCPVRGGQLLTCGHWTGIERATLDLFPQEDGSQN